MNAGVEAKLVDRCNARSARARFIVTAVIIDTGWLGLHTGISATIHNYTR